MSRATFNATERFYRRLVSAQGNGSQRKVIHRIVNGGQKIENQYFFNVHISNGFTGVGGGGPFHRKQVEPLHFRAQPKK